mgnify:CR=1 FL=1
MMGIHSSKLRASAKGQQCTFQIPGVCNHNPETTVLCHIRDDVKAMATKANDISAAFGCFSCHEAIDNHRLPKEDELAYTLRAMQRTHAIWLDLGLLVLPVDVVRPAKSSKIIPRRALVKGDASPSGRLWQPSQTQEQDYE